MQFKDGITPRHSPLPSTQEHAAKSYRVPAEAPCWGERTDAQSCREKGLPRAHTSSKLKSNKPTGLAASTRSSSGFPGRSGGCWRWVWLSGVPGRLVRLVRLVRLSGREGQPLLSRWVPEAAERRLWREEAAEALSCRWDTGTVLHSTAQSWQGSPPWAELLARLGRGGRLHLVAPPSRGIPPGRFAGQERALGRVSLSRAISSPALSRPDLALPLPVAPGGCSCLGRATLS